MHIIFQAQIHFNMLNINIKRHKISLIKETIITLFLIFLCILFAINKNYSKTVMQGLLIWLSLVVPSLFPYFFVVAFISKLKLTSKIANGISPFSKRVFNLSGTAFFCYIVGAFSGYPLGSKLVGEFKEKCILSETESERASMISSNASPMFLIGSVGSVMFNSIKFGALLFLTHIISSLISALIFSRYKYKSKPTNNVAPFIKCDAIFYESVYSSVISMLVVGGIIALFYLLTNILFDVGALNVLIKPLTLILGNSESAKGITFALFEYTCGLKILATSIPLKQALPIVSFICAFSGFSIIMQSVAYLKKAKIKTTPFLFSKLVVAIINFFVGLIISVIFF